MKVYVFLVRRPIDTMTWPCVYTDAERAKEAYGRVSPVVEIEIPETEKKQEDSTI